MKNPYANPNIESPVPEIRSYLGGSLGHGSEKEKRHSMVEYLKRIQKILSILPEDSKQRIALELGQIRKDPEKAVEIIRNEIELKRQIIDMLDHPEISTEEALRELDKLIPPTRVQ